MSRLIQTLKSRSSARVLAVAAIICVLVVTLAPVSSARGPVYLSPLDSMRAVRSQEGDFGLIQDVVENVVLFIPLGLFVARALPALARVPRMAFCAVGFSSLIELGQYVLPGGRDADTLDIITNTIGAVAGLLLLRLVAKVISGSTPRYRVMRPSRAEIGRRKDGS